MLEKLRGRFNNAQLTQLLKEYELAERPESLTNEQAKYLLQFGTLDAIRDRITAAQRGEGLETDASDADVSEPETQSLKHIEPNATPVFHSQVENPESRESRRRQLVGLIPAQSDGIAHGRFHTYKDFVA